MASTWRDALLRAAQALGRRRRNALNEGEATEDSGFTLIELMVVLLIMGILMAIAIPTFLGVTNSANDRSTQSNLTNVLTSAKAIYAQRGGYPASATMITDLTSDLPNFTYVASTVASTKQTQISVLTTAATTKTTFVAAAYMSKTTECWLVKDTAHGTTKYAKETTPATCKAGVTVAAATWKTKWPTPAAGK